MAWWPPPHRRTLYNVGFVLMLVAITHERTITPLHFFLLISSCRSA